MNPQVIIFIVVIAAAYYFLLIRPRQQETKKHQEMLGALSEGDEIMTIGGIYALVVEPGEKRIRVELFDGTEMEISPRAVGTVVPPEEREELEADDAEDADEPEDAELDAPAEDDESDESDA